MQKIHETAIGAQLVEKITTLEAENLRLRTALADCANHVGAAASPQCTLDFLEIIPQEVRLVTERLRREHATACLDAEKARQERNHVGVEIRREWIGKCEEVRKERDHWKANHDNLASRARFLIERGDLPIERVRAYEELGALQAFREFFEDRCEGLFAQFGMPAVDAYNVAALAGRHA